MMSATAIRIQPHPDHVRIVFLDHRGRPFAEAMLQRKEALIIARDLIELSAVSHPTGAMN